MSTRAPFYIFRASPHVRSTASSPETRKEREKRHGGLLWIREALTSGCVEEEWRGS